MNQTMINNFIVWQCALRQRNFRKFSGKPSEGTIAVILDKKSNNEIISLRSILMEKKVLNTAKMFKFMMKKTHDPEEKFLKAVNFFSSEYFENPNNFNGSFSATFSNNSKVVKKLLNKKKFNVQFFESPTGYNFPIQITKLKKNDSKWIYTFFHNSLFNPALNEDIEILLFNPEKTGFKKIS